MKRKFVVEFIDSISGCISGQSFLEIDDVLELCEIVDPGAANIHPAAQYELDDFSVREINYRFGKSLIVGAGTARLRSCNLLDDLPYKVHTGRELEFMLSQGKPFAAFSEYYPSDASYEYIPERYFDIYVNSGLFLKREYILLGEHRQRVVLYSRKSEEWRIDAYILLKMTMAKTGWNEGFERMEGKLLGYEEWQNDIFIEKIYKKR